MALRSGHGRGAGVPRVEVLPVDELPAGVPAPAGQPDAARAAVLAVVRRVDGGRLADRESAAALGRLGGIAKAERQRELAEVPALVQGLGLRDFTAADFKAYLDDAEKLAEHECERLGQVVGGGECGTGPSLIVATAALQIAGSRFEFARGNVAAGSKLGNDARQNLLAAHELCAREAAARPGPKESVLVAAIRAAGERPEAEP